MSKITNEVRLNLVWHRMLYSCTHMATVGFKGLMDQELFTDYTDQQYYLLSQLVTAVTTMISLRYAHVPAHSSTEPRRCSMSSCGGDSSSSG